MVGDWCCFGCLLMVGIDVYIAFMCLRVCFLYLIELPFAVICCVIVCLLAEFGVLVCWIWC